MRVTRVEKLGFTGEETYDLRVAVDHNFLVGESGLVAHNSGVGRSYDDHLVLADFDYAPTLRCVLDEDHPDFDWSAHESKRDALHKYGKNSKRVMWFEVPDSREGWAQALEVYENSAFERIHSHKMLILDFSRVRRRGAPIKGMQGRPASGPVPLMNAFNKAASLKGAGLPRWKQAMYVDHYFGECVLVGGARRAARMSTKYWMDPDAVDFIRVKRPIEFNDLSVDEVSALRKERKQFGFLWSSNNSVMVDAEFWALLDIKRGDERYGLPSARHARRVWRELTACSYGDGTGEPGVINADLLAEEGSAADGINGEPWVGSAKYEVREDTCVYLSRLAKRAKTSKYPMITNPCVAGETLVAVADGRGAVRIEDLAREGADVPVFCRSDGGDVVVRVMRNPRVTGRERVFRVLLDDGSVVRATGNHKLLMRSGEYREVSALEPGDSLSLLVKYQTSLPGKKKNYWMLRHGLRGGSEHRLVSEFFRNAKIPADHVVHHRNHDGLDNRPDNLEVMSAEDHAALHRDSMLGNRNPMRRASSEWSAEKMRSYRDKMSWAVREEKNGRYSGFTNEQLRETALELTRELGRQFSLAEWAERAKLSGLPTAFSGWRRKHLGGIKSLARWAAVECGFEVVDADPRVAARLRDALREGYDAEIVEGRLTFRKRCEVCDAQFETPRRENGVCSRSCASVKSLSRPETRKKISQSSAGYYSSAENREKHSELLLAAHQVKREQKRSRQLEVYASLRSSLQRDPSRGEWRDECRLRGVSAEVGRSSSPFRHFSALEAEADFFNHRVVSVTPDGEETVYNGTVDEFHNFYVGGFEGVTRDGKRKQSFLCNQQCGEIRLHVLGGFCIVGDVVPFHAFTLSEAESAFRAATRALIRVNLMSSIYSREVRRTNRIGVGITGIHEFAWKFFRVGFKDLVRPDFERLDGPYGGPLKTPWALLDSPEDLARFSDDPRIRAAAFWRILERMRDACVEEADSYSAELGLAPPKTVTTIKPAGCGVLSTRVRTPRGVVTLGEMFEASGVDLGAMEAGEWFEPTSGLTVLDENDDERAVTKLFCNGEEEVFRIEMEDGSVEEFTGNHCFKTTEGWKRVDELDGSEEVVCPRENQPLSVASVERLREKKMTVDIEVESTHTYQLESGAVVHNTTSKLFGLTEGWHLPPNSSAYLRWVQFRSDDPLVEEYRSAGYPTRELTSYKDTTIVGFPTAPAIVTLGMGDELVTSSEATPEEQYEWLRLGEKYWIGSERGNQISYTLHYDPEKVSYSQFCRVLKENQRTVKACTVMPREDSSAYEYTPEEAINKVQYEELMRKINRDIAEDVGREHVDCASGACPIDFKERSAA